MKLKRKPLTDGPLKTAIFDADTPAEMQAALNAYGDNLAAVLPISRAQSIGALILGIFAVLMSVAVIVMGVTGLGHATYGFVFGWILSALSLYLSARATRTRRRAVAGHPA